jgi:hypothetical protein
MHIVNSEELDDYLSQVQAKGEMDLVLEAKDWAEWMEKALDNYVGPPLSMDYEQLSSEGVIFLLHFWSYQKQLANQIPSN